MFKTRIDHFKHAFSALFTKIPDKTFDFKLIEKYFSKIKSDDTFQVISQTTRNDLDFDQLFTFLDKTTSTIGQQYLFAQLLTLKKKRNFSEQEALINFFNSHEGKCQKTRQLLSKLCHKKGYYLSSLFQDDFIKPTSHMIFIKALSISSLLSLILSIVMPSFLILTIVFFIINMIFHFRNKKYIEMYSGTIPQLFTLHKCAKKMLSLGLPHKGRENIKYALESINQIKNTMALFILESRQDADPFTGLLNLVLEYLKIQFLLEPILVFYTLNKLQEKQKHIQLLFEFIGRIDTALSIASLRNNLDNYCLPRFSDENTSLSFEKIYHPLINQCVSNSLSLDSKSILLTGSNMSGKTTFIRTVGLNVLTAQSINTCFASNFSLKPMKIFSAIRINDDLSNHKSYYFEEVLTVNKMIQASRSDEPALFLLDEIFKGTNTIERIAAGKAVLSYLCQNENLVFVSTHDIELTHFLKSQYQLFHFTETVEQGEIHFDFKLKEGELKSRNAIRILEINDYPEEIINEAQEISKELSGLSQSLKI